MWVESIRIASHAPLQGRDKVPPSQRLQTRGTKPTMVNDRERTSMTQLIQRFLGTGDALARLRDHAARLRRLQAVLEQHLPPALASACAVANVKNDTLVLLAHGGAVAARLKQIAPTLAEQFGAAGLPIRTIQVKVQVIEEHEAPRPAPDRTLSEAGRRSLADFSSSLPADSPLRESLERLIDRSRAG